MRRARSATASPPVPAPFPLPLPPPVPPAPVPGPRTSDDPWVVSVPCRGVSVVAITGTGGTWICGLGAMTGVAWLLMFFGAEVPCLGLGWTGFGGAGGGRGGLVTSKTFNTLCGSARSIFPDTCSSANNSAACTATTAMIAPLREPGSRSVRYATHIQRERSARVAGLTRLQTGRALGIEPGAARSAREVSGWRCSCDRRRGLLFRLCLRSRAAWLGPLPRSRAWHHRSSLALL